jgi:hypothetical protein
MTIKLLPKNQRKGSHFFPVLGLFARSFHDVGHCTLQTISSHCTILQLFSISTTNHLRQYNGKEETSSSSIIELVIEEELQEC